MAESYVSSTGPAAGLAAVTANGSSAAIPMPRGEFETSLWVTSTGSPTGGTVAIDISRDGGTTWVAGLATSAVISTANVQVSVVLPPGVNAIRHTLAGLTGGTAPTVTSVAYFRQRS